MSKKLSPSKYLRLTLLDDGSQSLSSAMSSEFKGFRMRAVSILDQPQLDLN